MVVIYQSTTVNSMASANSIELKATANANPNMVPVYYGGDTIVIETVILVNSSTTLRILTIYLITYSELR